jgi:hypothetical protein
MGLGGHIAEQQYSAMNVPFGSKADIGLAAADVRFTPKADIESLIPVGTTAVKFYNL